MCSTPNYNRWAIVRDRLFGTSVHITSNVGYSLEEPLKHPDRPLSKYVKNHLKYVELQDILMPSLNKAVGLAIALNEIENIFAHSHEKINKKTLISEKATQEFIKYFEITNNTGPEPDYREVFRGIHRECKEIFSGRQPEHYAKIATTLVAVLRFIRVTGKRYENIKWAMNSSKGFFTEILKNFEELSEEDKEAMIPKITWVRPEEVPLMNAMGRLTGELLRYLRFATTRVVMRLDNANIEEMNNELS